MECHSVRKEMPFIWKKKKIGFYVCIHLLRLNGRLVFFFLCIEKLTLKSFLSIKTVRFTGMKIPVLLSAGFNGDPD